MRPPKRITTIAAVGLTLAAIALGRWYEKGDIDVGAEYHVEECRLKTCSYPNGAFSHRDIEADLEGKRKIYIPVDSFSEEEIENMLERLHGATIKPREKPSSRSRFGRRATFYWDSMHIEDSTRMHEMLSGRIKALEAYMNSLKQDMDSYSDGMKNDIEALDSEVTALKKGISDYQTGLDDDFRGFERQLKAVEEMATENAAEIQKTKARPKRVHYRGADWVETGKNSAGRTIYERAR